MNLSPLVPCSNLLKKTTQRADERNEPLGFQLVRHIVGPQQKTNYLPMVQKMMEADGSLSLCYYEMTVFRSKLTKDQSRVKKSLKWLFERDEIKNVIGRLRNLVSLFDTAVASDHV